MRKLCGIFEKISFCQFYRKYSFFILNTAFYGAEYGLLSSKTWQHWLNIYTVSWTVCLWCRDDVPGCLLWLRSRQHHLFQSDISKMSGCWSSLSSYLDYKFGLPDILSYFLNWISIWMSVCVSRYVVNVV